MKVFGQMNSNKEISGPVLRLDEPLSFWGGLDPETGQITDVHHPQVGASVTGTVLAMEHGRGSSSSSSVVLELIRNKAGPVAIVLSEMDTHILLGSIVAEELYGLSMPVLIASKENLQNFHSGNIAHIDSEGNIKFIN